MTTEAKKMPLIGVILFGALSIIVTMFALGIIVYLPRAMYVDAACNQAGYSYSETDVLFGAYCWKVGGNMIPLEKVRVKKPPSGQVGRVNDLTGFECYESNKDSIICVRLTDHRN